jgi:hypothetical protein
LDTTTASLQATASTLETQLVTAQGNITVNSNNMLDVQADLDEQVLSQGVLSAALDVLSGVVEGIETSLQSLNDRFDTLVDDVASLEPLLEGVSSPHEPSYSYAAATPGDVVTVGPFTFRLVKMPFLEFGTGQPYAITMPMVIRPYKGGESMITLKTKHELATVVSDFEVSGYPAILAENTDSRSVVVGAEEGAGGVFTSTLQISQSSASVFTIAVEETTIKLTIQISLVEDTVSGIALSEADFSLKPDWSKMQHSDLALSYVDELIDYIKIEAVTID